MKKALSVLLLVMLTLPLLIACGGGSAPKAPAASAPAASAPAAGSAAPAKKLTVGGAWPSVDVGFWGTNWDGFEDKMNELGHGFIQVVAGTGGADMQADQIKTLIAQKVDAIVAGVVDGSAAVAFVKEAQAAGIPVVLNNRPLQSADVIPDMAILSENEAMTYDLLTWLAEDARETKQKFNILLMMGNPSDENAVQRYKGHKRAIEDNSDVLSLVAEIPATSQQVALEGVQNSLQAYDNINCVVCHADGLVPTICSALEQFGKLKKWGEPGYVAICSFDGSADAMRGYVNKAVYCTAVQDSYGQGAASAEWAVRLAKGEKPAVKKEMNSGFQINYKTFEETKEKVWGWPVYLKQEEAKK